MADPGLRVKTCLMCVCFAVGHLVFYTLQFSSATGLPGDPFLVFSLVALVDLPSAAVIPFVVERFGRVRVSCVSFVCGGVCCLCTAALRGWPGVVLGSALLGKCFASGAYLTVMQMCSEYYPTPARGAGVGFVALLSHAAYSLMPLIRATSHWNPELPRVISGLIAFVGAAFCAFLPETKFQPLPQTFQEAHLIGDVGFKALKRNLCCGKRHHDASEVPPSSPAEEALIRTVHT